MGGKKGGGSSSPPPQLPTSVDFSTPSFRFSAKDIRSDLKGGITATGSTARPEFSSRVPKLLEDIRGLREKVGPGVDALRASQLNALADARERTISSLKGSLSRRKLAGSSFALDTLARAESEFGRAAADIEAKSIFQEIEANNKQIAFEFDTIANALGVELNELGIGTNFTSNMVSAFSNNAQFAQQQSAQSSAGVGGFFGNLIGLGLSFLA